MMVGMMPIIVVVGEKVMMEVYYDRRHNCSRYDGFFGFFSYDGWDDQYDSAIRHTASGVIHASYWYDLV